MAQSIADVLQSTGRVPQLPASALQPPPGTGEDTFGPLIKQAQEDSSKLKAKGEKLSAKIEEGNKKLDEIQPPKIPELAPVPKAQQSDPFQAFGSAAGWIATFGSMLTRAPLTSSLNAASAAMNAAKENNAQAFQQNFDVWKAETDNAIKLHQFEMDSYKEALEKIKAGDDSALADIQVTAASFKNDTLQLLAAKGQADEVKSYLKAMADQGKKTAENADKTEAFALFQQWKMANPNATPEEMAKKLHEFTDPKIHEAEAKSGGATTPTWDQPAIEKAADAVAKGVPITRVVPGYGAHNPNRDAVMNDLAKRHPDIDLAAVEASFSGQMQEQRTESGIAGKIKFAANSLDQSIPLLREAAKNVDLTQFTDLNALENYYKTHTSDTNLAAFRTAIQATMSDYSSLIARNGIPTDATRAKAESLVNSAMGKGSLEGFMSQVEKEKDAQLKAASLTTGRDEGEASLKTYSSEDYKKAIKDKNLKPGNHFLSSDGVEHVVQ